MVNVDDFVEKVDAVQGVKLSWLNVRPPEMLRQCFVKDVDDQRAFAGTGNAGDADQATDRDVDVDFFQVVLFGASDFEKGTVPFPAGFWDGDGFSSR